MVVDKILIITPFSPKGTGGAETFTQELARVLAKKYEVHICTISVCGIWQGMPYFKSILMALRLALAVKKMYKPIYKKVYALGLMASCICVLLRIKYSAVMLALYDFTKPNIYTKILNKAEKVFVEGNTGEIEMERIGVNYDKIIKFQHWCNQSIFCYKEKNNKNLKVLFIGRPIKIKGKHIIEECQQQTKDIDYEYIENVKYEDLPKHYQMADVVVVPSLYSEGIPRVVIEAASCGCAVIASAKGALPELVYPFGKVIEPIPQNFATELTKLKLNRQALLKIQMNTTIYALVHFSERNAHIFL